MARHTAKYRRKKYALLLVISLLVFVLSAYFASRRILFPWEKTLLEHIYNHPAWLHWPGLIITQFGSAWMLVVVSFLFLLGHRRSQEWGRFVIINGGVTYLLVETTKRIVGRPRPAELLNEVIQKEPFVHGAGFPSGHTAMATIVSFTLVRFMSPKWRWLPLLWIGLVGWSRLFLGVHAPLDVLGGFSLGMCVVSLERLINVP